MKLLKAQAILGFATLAALACPFAMAEEPGFYVGGNVGRSSSTIDFGGISSRTLGPGYTVNSISGNSRDTSWKLYGGYQFTPNFALEGGYYDLGNYGFTTNTTPPGTLRGDFRFRGVNMDVVGSIPITEKFSAFARLGVTYGQTRDSFSGTGAVFVPAGSANPSKREANGKAGIGLSYAINENLAVRLEGERYRVNDAVGNKARIDLVSLGLTYRFGPKSPTPVARAYAPAPAPAPVVVAAAPAPVMAPPPPAPAPAPATVVVVMPAKVSFSAEELFDFDKSVVKPSGRMALDKFAGDLKSTKYDSIKVTGNTDRLGSHAYNQKLSEHRANAVSAYLVSAGGVPPAKIVASGVGETNPVTKDCKGGKATPALIACLQPDRRVDVEVTGTR